MHIPDFWLSIFLPFPVPPEFTYGRMQHGPIIHLNPLIQLQHRLHNLGVGRMANATRKVGHM